MNFSLLIEEIDKYDAKRKELEADSNSVKVKDFRKTSLNQSVSIFLQFLKPMEQEWKQQRQEVKLASEYMQIARFIHFTDFISYAFLFLADQKMDF